MRRFFTQNIIDTPHLIVGIFFEAVVESVSTLISTEFFI